MRTTREMADLKWEEDSERRWDMLGYGCERIPCWGQGLTVTTTQSLNNSKAVTMTVTKTVTSPFSPSPEDAAQDTGSGQHPVHPWLDIPVGARKQIPQDVAPHAAPAAANLWMEGRGGAEDSAEVTEKREAKGSRRNHKVGCS